MSRLSDLLNPAPNSSPAPTVPGQASADHRQPSHTRDQSLSTPLEGLALTPPNDPTASQAPDGGARGQARALESATGDSALPAANDMSPQGPSTAQAIPLDSAVKPKHPLSDLSLAASTPEGSAGASSRRSAEASEAAAGTDGPSRQDQEDLAMPKVANINPAALPASATSEGLTVPSPLEAQTGEAHGANAIQPEASSRPSTEQRDLQASVQQAGRDVSALEPTDAEALTSGSMGTDPSTKVLPSKEGLPKISSRTSQKKGATSSAKKQPAKKRKIDASSKDETPASQRSGTPASSRASKTPVPRNQKQQSTTPAPSVTSPALHGENDDEGDDEEFDDDAEVFCICRKPDDHTWMIGCDGGCEDWFHGHCIDITERDENLIDKYICPNCVSKGVGVTTWKPMCRLDTCRNPARARDPTPSKYCSDEHGEQYMRQRVFGRGSAGSKQPPKKKRKEEQIDLAAEPDGHGEPPEPAHLRGGDLLPGELKALASGVDSLQDFQKLGDPVAGQLVGREIEPARTEDGSGPRFTPTYTPAEAQLLDAISKKRDRLQSKLDASKARQRFAELIRGRARDVLEHLKKKDKALKDICGFDARLSWPDAVFDEWRLSDAGRQVLDSGALGPPSSPSGEGEQGSGDQEMVDADSAGANELGAGICQKKRCERHKGWYQLQLQEVAFEREECRQERARLEKEEKGIMDRAVHRDLESPG